MTPDDVARFARHIALPEIGPEGQERISAARVLLVGDDLVAETARRYLEAAGATVSAAPARGLEAGAWSAALAGVTAVVRTGFDDDAMLMAARAAGVPVVVARAEGETIDVLSFRHRPKPGAEVSDVPPSPARPPAPPSAAAVVAGTLAAVEALWLIVGRPGLAPEGARHLRLPLDGGDARVQDIP